MFGCELLLYGIPFITGSTWHDIMNKKNRGAMSLLCIKNLSKTPVIGFAVWLFQHIFKLRCGIYETVSNMNNTCGSSD